MSDYGTLPEGVAIRETSSQDWVTLHGETVGLVGWWHYRIDLTAEQPWAETGPPAYAARWMDRQNVHHERGPFATEREALDALLAAFSPAAASGRPG